MYNSKAHTHHKSAQRKLQLQQLNDFNQIQQESRRKKRKLNNKNNLPKNHWVLVTNTLMTTFTYLADHWIKVNIQFIMQITNIHAQHI